MKGGGVISNHFLMLLFLEWGGAGVVATGLGKFPNKNFFYTFPNLTNLCDFQYFLDHSICAHLLHHDLQYLICARERR